MSKWNPIARNCSGHEYETACSTGHQSLQTLEPPILDQWPDWWISSLRASRVNLTPQPDNALARAMTATSGPTPYRCYGRWNPATSSWRMSRDWLTGLTRTLRKSLGVFPRRGMTLHGTCYPLLKPVPRTSESGGCALLPTPTGTAYGSSNNYKITEGTMARQGRWMTPNVMGSLTAKSQRALDHEHDTARPGRSNPNNLRDQVQVEEGQRTWPTPAARDWRSDKSQMTNEELYGTKGHPLPRAVGGQLNPDWVEWLMGIPIGWTDLEPLPEGNYAAWEAPGWWDEEPDIPRVGTGMPNRVNRLKAIGNGIVPACVALFLNAEEEEVGDHQLRLKLEEE
jgi:hypothetical protein